MASSRASQYQCWDEKRKVSSSVNTLRDLQEMQEEPKLDQSSNKLSQEKQATAASVSRSCQNKPKKSHEKPIIFYNNIAK